MPFEAEIVPRIGEIDRADWERCLPNEAENHDYYRACEESPHASYAIMAGVVRRAGTVVAVAPAFVLTYRLDTPFQGALRRMSERIYRAAPRLISFKVLALGSPLAERCHLGFAPELSPPERAEAFDALLGALGREARSLKAGLVALKDLDGRDAERHAETLRQRGFARVNSLPVAVLDLPSSEEAYIARLSTNTRSSFRRKLKSAKHLRIEYREAIDGLEDEIMSLYEETRTQSGLDYGDLETLPAGYFGAVMRNLNQTGNEPARAGILLFWLEDRLIGFNLLLFEPGRVIDKFIGRRYPVSKDYHLFFVGWMENVRVALKRGASTLQSGQTHYAVKVRLGSRLEPSFLYFRHRNPLINRVLRLISGLIAFDKLDPDLRELRKADKA
ncbi:MAG: GNAT family N-acetyltransferase [Beijerinckiaceae bacterium]|nr:GNAT family N-acetyltransferase [Beijerinckiaceae bacterium]